MPENEPLVKEVFRLVREEFLGQAAAFERNVNDCYNHERVPVR